MPPNYIKDLLDLEDVVIITKTVHADKYVKFFLDTKPRPHICPVCGNSTTKIHDYRWQTIKDLPFQIHYSCPPLKEAVSIDEFKGNSCTGKYQCILVNPKDRSIIDILPDRTQSHLTSYFREIDHSQRLRVRYFVYDMWQPYVDLAHTFFPNAKVCIDKYHFIRHTG